MQTIRVLNFENSFRKHHQNMKATVQKPASSPASDNAISLTKTVEDMLAEPLNSLGYRLLEVQFLHEGQRILRIMIDSPNGIGLGDCSRASALISPLLDVENLGYQGGYQLEITSPGLFRCLSKPLHFVQSLGKRAKITLDADWACHNAVNAPLQLAQTGVIESIHQDILHLNTGDQTLQIPLAQVCKANLEPLLDFQ